MLTQTDTLERIADTIAGLPKSWQSVQTRADVFHALEAAWEKRDLEQRVMTWERIRYLAGFPTGTGARIPLYSTMSDGAQLDPYTDGEPPTFEQLLGALNRAGGWER